MNYYEMNSAGIEGVWAEAYFPKSTYPTRDFQGPP